MATVTISPEEEAAVIGREFGYASALRDWEINKEAAARAHRHKFVASIMLLILVVGLMVNLRIELTAFSSMLLISFGALGFYVLQRVCKHDYR